MSNMKSGKTAWVTTVRSWTLAITVLAAGVAQADGVWWCPGKVTDQLVSASTDYPDPPAQTSCEVRHFNGREPALLWRSESVSNVVCKEKALAELGKLSCETEWFRLTDLEEEWSGAGGDVVIDDTAALNWAKDVAPISSWFKSLRSSTATEEAVTAELLKTVRISAGNLNWDEETQPLDPGSFEELGEGVVSVTPLGRSPQTEWLFASAVEGCEESALTCGVALIGQDAGRPRLLGFFPGRLLFYVGVREDGKYPRLASVSTLGCGSAAAEPIAISVHAFSNTLGMYVQERSARLPNCIAKSTDQQE